MCFASYIRCISRLLRHGFAGIYFYIFPVTWKDTARRYLNIIACYFIATFCSSIWATQQERIDTNRKDDGAYEVQLDKSKDKQLLIPFSSIIKDSDHSLTEKDVINFKNRHLPENHPLASLGFSDATIWFVVAIQNTESAPLNRLLVFEPTWLDQVSVTLIQQDGTRKNYQGGDQFGFSHRSLDKRQINFDLSIPPGKNTIIIKTRTRDPYLVGIALWNPAAFIENDGKELAYFGVIYGALASLLLFNLALFFSIREPIYAAYVGYLASFLILNFTYRGFSFPLLWEDHPEWGNWAHSIFVYIFSISGIIFSVSFLNLKTHLPKGFRIASVVLIGLLISCAITPLGGYALHVRTAMVFVNLMPYVSLFLGVWSLRNGNGAARFFLLASVAGIVGTIITSLVVVGIIPFSSIGYRSAEIGFLIDAIMLSVALADRLRIARMETDRARLALIENARLHTQQLERTVAERTLDLTNANKALELSLKQTQYAQEVAEQASKVKSIFLANMSHEIRTPMNAIIGFAHLLRRGESRPEQVERIKKIISAGNHLLSIINDILNLSKIEAGCVTLEQINFPLSDVMDHVVSLIGQSCKSKGLSVQVDYGSVPHWLEGDPTRLRQALLNFAGNAVKFTEQGYVILRARLLEESGTLLHIQFEVEDSGIGIAQEHIAQIFNPFQQADISTTRKYGGTGLGLTITARLAELMKGQVGVKSEPGKGSIFWFTAWLKRGHPIAKPVQTGEADDAVTLLATQYRGARILLADDDLINQEVAVDILSNTHLNIEVVANGKQAVEKALAEQFALILMDMQMPEMDGLDATRKIREIPGYRDTPIIALTGNAYDDDKLRCLDAGMSDVLIKPVVPKHLVNTLLSWMNQTAPRHQQKEPLPYS